MTSNRAHSCRRSCSSVLELKEKQYSSSYLSENQTAKTGSSRKQITLWHHPGNRSALLLAWNPNLPGWERRCKERRTSWQSCSWATIRWRLWKFLQCRIRGNPEAVGDCFSTEDTRLCRTWWGWGVNIVLLLHFFWNVTTNPAWKTNSFKLLYLQSQCLVSGPCLGSYPCFTAHFSLLLYKDGVCGCQVQRAHPAPPGGHSVEQPDFLNLKEGSGRATWKGLPLIAAVIPGVLMWSLHSETHPGRERGSRRTLADYVADEIPTR